VLALEAADISINAYSVELAFRVSSVLAVHAASVILRSTTADLAFATATALQEDSKLVI
jgi:hypothetical protein